MVTDIPIQRRPTLGGKGDFVHPLKTGVQFFLDGRRLPPSMRVMTADPCAVKDIAIGNDAGGLEPLDKLQQRLIGDRAATGPEVRVGEDDDMPVDYLGGALAGIGPGLRVGGLRCARTVDGMRFKDNAAIRHLLATAIDLADLDVKFSGYD